MAAQGRRILVKALIGATYTTIAGLRSRTLTVNNETINITNFDSAFWRELKPGGLGIRSVSISGSGVFKNDVTANYLESLVLGLNSNVFRVVFENGDRFDGAFRVTSLNYNGGVGDVQTHDFTMVNSGPVTFTRQPSAGAYWLALDTDFLGSSINHTASNPRFGPWATQSPATVNTDGTFALPIWCGTQWMLTALDGFVWVTSDPTGAAGWAATANNIQVAEQGVFDPVSGRTITISPSQQAYYSDAVASTWVSLSGSLDFGLYVIKTPTQWIATISNGAAEIPSNVYRSITGSPGTWSAAPSGAGLDGYAMARNPLTGTICMVQSIFSTSQIVRTTDEFNTTTLVGAEIPLSGVIALQASIIVADAGVFVVAGFRLSPSPNIAIWRSIDDGLTWQDVSPVEPSTSPRSMAIHGATVVFAVGNVGLYVSTDFGATWTLAFAYNPASEAGKVAFNGF